MVVFRGILKNNLKTILFLLMAFICNVIILNFNISTYATDFITLNLSTNNLAVNLAPLSSSGDFAKSADMNISVSTTSPNGYTLSIASSTGSTDLTNQSDNTKKINSISSPISESDFSNSSNTQYNNKWGYRPSQYITFNNNNPVINQNNSFRSLPDDNGEILAKTQCANGTSPCTNATDTYTLSIGARANNQTITGKYTSDAFIITAVANHTLIPCDPAKLCIEYEGNGLTYDGDTLNRVNYSSITTTLNETKYFHTPNVSDAGEASGTYSSSMNTTDTVTIDGATSLNVTIYYDAESTTYDWVSVYQSPFDISNTNDATVSTTTGNLSGKLSGRNSGRTTTYSSWYTKSYTVSGDTVKFHFKSDGSGNYYGYYAIITGTGAVRERSVSSGEYATPTGINAIFHGWSTTQKTAGGGLPSDVEYADETAIKTKMPGDEGETKTIYAVWQQGYPITFTYDSNVSSVIVLDSNGTTIGNINSSDQSLILFQGNTYIIRPEYNTRYAPNDFAKLSGAGTLTGDNGYSKEFQVGAGTATISITSQYVNTQMQNYSCSNLVGVGSVQNVYDTRDNEVYLIGKLADGNCWMLDNLRLDLNNINVSNVMDSTNTNSSDSSLNYLRNGGGTSTNQYAITGLTGTNWLSGVSYSSPLINTSGINSNGEPYTKDKIVLLYGKGSGKIGTYYNYCAISAGSYCWGDGASSSGSPSGTSTSRNGSFREISDDICPKGWHLPTGGTWNSEFDSLYKAYADSGDGQDKAFITAFSVVPSSSYSGIDSVASYQSTGKLISSTRMSANTMHNLAYKLSPYISVYPNENYSGYGTISRYHGGNIRCIANE